MATMKTYSFLAYHPGIDPTKPWINQAIACVAARSKAEVCRLLSTDDFRPLRPSDLHNLSETGNLAQIVVSMGAPGIVFHANHFSANFRPAGGQPLGIPPTDPEVLIDDHAARWPTSHLIKEARAAMPEIRAAWDTARVRWPKAEFAH